MKVNHNWAMVWLAGVLVFYWVPVFGSAVGWGKWVALPKRVTFQRAVAALFPKRQAAWSHPVYQVRTKRTNGKWVDLDRWLMSEIEVAGYRHRVDRLISMVAKSSKTGNRILASLAEHAAVRVEETRPDLGRLTGFRVLTLIFPTNTPEMAHPSGQWEIPEPDRLDPKRVRLTVEVEVKEGKAVAVKRGGASFAIGDAPPKTAQDSRNGERDLEDQE